ncbi:CocE/NonD family hydrolase [Frankia sp. Cpl3]|nr:CocE/NonD family hydrolase [Frankia sp. Cpl3]
MSSTTRAWWGYTREATFASTRSTVSVPVADGTALDCSLLRPATNGAPAEGKFPGLVVEFTPYAELRTSYEGEAEYFVTRGYNSLICNVRGTGRSGGTWQNAGSAQDRKDARDLVEWLAAQPFSDGRIGMFGESYGGQTSYGAAIEQAPHLVAVAPLQSPASLYDDVIYPGGIKTTESGAIDNWPPTAQFLSQGRIDAAAEYATNRQHPTFDDYWQSRSFAGRYDRIKVPVLAMGGWIDGYFRSGTLANIEGALDRTWAVYGPWPHRSPIAFPGCTGLCDPAGLAPGLLLAWFDHWVKKLPAIPIPPRPTFVSYERPDAGGAGWREIVNYSPRNTVGTRTLSLTAEGTLSEQTTGQGTGTGSGVGVGGASSAPAESAGAPTFHQPADPTAPGGSVTFRTAPLTEPRAVFGHPTLRLRASPSGSDANLYVELLDVAADGTTTLVNDGFLRASHRASHTSPTPVAVGAVTTFEIGIRANHYQFAAGHRVAVRISGGAANALTPNATPVDVTIVTGAEGSVLRLPTIPPASPTTSATPSASIPTTLAPAA